MSTKCNLPVLSARSACGLATVLLALSLAPAVSAAETPLKNSSFEAGQAKPDHWGSKTYNGKARHLHSETARTGKRSVLVESYDGADATWNYHLPVRPFSTYKLSGYIKTANLTKTTGQGALLNIHQIPDAKTQALTGTNDWTHVETTFKTGTRTLVLVNCLFGGWGQATGAAWYDDVQVELIEAGTLPPAEVTIDAAKPGRPISPYIYGQFIEHLGRCIYGGIWGQMLEDRKFYYPIGHAPSPWVKIGGEADWSMTMDVTTRYGERWSAEIAADTAGESLRGIAQDRLGLVKGKKYTGYVVLAGRDPGLEVEITLRWGDQPGDEQLARVTGLTDEFRKYPVEFTAGATTDNARFAIGTRGRGIFHVGTAALFPADNVDGLRADTLELLKKLDSPIYRWPGGNFVSGYDWRDGIGPRDLRPPRKNPAWKGIEHNDFGIDEFIQFCRAVGTEPLVVVNTGEGSARLAAQLLEYCNGSAATVWGKRRAQNGHPEPHNVTWWGIGNEMYGGWQLGHIPLERYTRRHNAFVKAMKRVDPNIKTIAVGATGPWSETMLRHCAGNMTALSEHFYVQESPDVLAHTRLTVDQVIRKADKHRKYQKQFPDAANIPVALDEWNYWHRGPHIFGELGIRYYLRDALGIARGLHEMTRHSDVFLMANLAQTVNVIGAIKTTKTTAFFSTIGLPMTLYRRHYGTTPLKVAGETFGLDAAAALTDDRKFLTLGVVNSLSEKRTLTCNYAGITLGNTARQFLITADDPMAANTPEQPQNIATVEKNLEPFNPKEIDVAPLSVNLYVVPVR